MLNETENEETRLFCHIFYIGGISIGGDPGCLGLPPLATPIILTSMLFVMLNAVNHPANSGGLQQLKLNYNF